MAEGYLWRKGGREFGPASLADARKMIRSGAIGRFQDISSDGGATWSPASTFAELWESTDLVPIPPEPETPVVSPTVPAVVTPTHSAYGELVPDGPHPAPPARAGRGLGLAGFITATTGLVLTTVPLLFWMLRYADGYWAVPLVFPLLVASVTGLVLSCVGMARRPGGFATSGLVVGLCGTALGLVTTVGWLVAGDPRDAWAVRLTATAEADVQLARRNFDSSLKAYREPAPKDDKQELLERLTKDLLVLSRAHYQLLQAAAATPRFRGHFVRLEDLKTAVVNFKEAVGIRDKIDAREAIDRVDPTEKSLEKLLDLYDLYQTGRLSIESVSAKFRDS